MEKRVVFHVDVNSAFLSWEAVYRIKFWGGQEDLRQIPSAVAGDPALRHGIILAKSIPAKRCQIRTGESIPEALAKCRDLVLVPPRYALYERASAAFFELLREYSPAVEAYSVDEAFLDMSGTESLFGPPEQAAEQLKDRIRTELGFTVNVGISTNKVLAKMAGEFRKPDQVHTLYPWEIRRKLWPLPVSELFFVGRATAGKLLSLGIRTVGELAAADLGLLRSRMKKQGEVIWGFANGIDFAPVLPEPPECKGYGNSVTVAFDVADARTAKLVLLALAETVAHRLRGDGVCAELVAVSVKYDDFTSASHQSVLANATDITNEIHAAACRLFGELWDGRPIRHLGIHTGRIRAGGGARQLELFPAMDYGKWSRMDRAVDGIRRRHGNDAVRRAVFIGSRIDHMSGGISRERG